MKDSSVTVRQTRPVMHRSAGRIALRLGAVSVFLLLGACATKPFYDYPPLMPNPIEPQAGALLHPGEPVEFVWTRTEDTESFDFHVFNATNSDISQYMKTDLSPESVCTGNRCSINLYLSLPESDRHAWRVRASNVAGKSSWTRTLFGFAPKPAR